MMLLLKDPDATLDYSVDWGAEYLADDALSESRWAVAPEEVGGIAVASDRFDPRTATVKVESGIAGHVYRLTNHVVTASGRGDSRSIMLRVEKR